MIICSSVRPSNSGGRLLPVLITSEMDMRHSRKRLSICGQSVTKPMVRLSWSSLDTTWRPVTLQ